MSFRVGIRGHVDSAGSFQSFVFIDTNLPFEAAKLRLDMLSENVVGKITGVLCVDLNDDGRAYLYDVWQKPVLVYNDGEER